MPVDDVALAAQGDTGAFERVYRAHLGRVYNLARRMAGPQAADEVAQDVFVRVWQKLHTFRGESSFATWLHRLAVNVIVERFRALGTARDRFLSDSEETLERLPASAPGPLRYDTRLDLDTALKRLPPGARTVFVLHDVEGYRHEEIGDMLGVSIGTSKSQLHRASGCRNIRTASSPPPNGRRATPISRRARTAARRSRRCSWSPRSRARTKI
jgi:RNA polymerase sigma-70 factor (ECF subfamily)